MVFSNTKLILKNPLTRSAWSRSLTLGHSDLQRRPRSLNELPTPPVKLGPTLIPSLGKEIDPDSAMSENDRITSHVKNKNPMNLERMGIGYKPRGFPLERQNRNYWNRLELNISGKHTTATVAHWTGRKVCSASTREFEIAKFLHNNTDMAALQAVGKIVAQRCLETGLHEVFLELRDEDFEKEKMKLFVQAVKDAGLLIGEMEQYEQRNPFRGEWWKKSFKAWEVHEDK